MKANIHGYLMDGEFLQDCGTDYTFFHLPADDERTNLPELLKAVQEGVLTKVYKSVGGGQWVVMVKTSDIVWEA